MLSPCMLQWWDRKTAAVSLQSRKIVTNRIHGCCFSVFLHHLYCCFAEHAHYQWKQVKRSPSSTFKLSLNLKFSLLAFLTTRSLINYQLQLNFYFTWMLPLFIPLRVCRVEAGAQSQITLKASASFSIFFSIRKFVCWEKTKVGEPRRANKRAKPAPIYWGSDLLKHPCHLLHFTFNFEGNFF